MTFSVGQREPTGLDVILEGLGVGVGQGLQQSLEQYHQKKSTEQTAKSLSKFIPEEQALSILGSPKELQKPLLYQALYESQVGRPEEKMGRPEQQFGVNMSNEAAPTAQPRGLSSLSDDRLRALLANPVAAKSAESELTRRENLKKDVRRSDIKRSDKYLDEVNKARDSTMRAKSSLASIESALERRDLGFFSPDNLKSMAGFDKWITPEGAILNTAGKEFFIADLERVTGRPNMFLERILSRAIPQIGKSNEANQVIVEFYKNALDLKEEQTKIADNLEDYYRENMGYVPGNIGRLVDAQLKPYAKQKEKELTQIFKRGKEKFGRRKEGKLGKITTDIATDILREAKGDRQLARKIAKKRGYTF